MKRMIWVIAVVGLGACGGGGATGNADGGAHDAAMMPGADFAQGGPDLAGGADMAAPHKGKLSLSLKKVN